MKANERLTPEGLDLISIRASRYGSQSATSDTDSHLLISSELRFRGNQIFNSRERDASASYLLTVNANGQLSQFILFQG